MAGELTRRRGALEVVDKKARDKRTVSPSWLRTEWMRIERGSMVRTWQPAKMEAPEIARVVVTEAAIPANGQEETKGGTA